MSEWIQYGALGLLAMIIISAIAGVRWLFKEFVAPLVPIISDWFQKDIEHREANTETLKGISETMTEIKDEIKRKPD